MKAALSLLTALGIALQPIHASACMAEVRPTLTDELVSFKSCQDLDAHVAKLVKSESRRNLGRFGGTKALRDGSAADAVEYSLAAPAAEMAKGSGIAGMAEAKAESSANQITGTNNQHANVDEADFVKFNGKHIYQIHENTLKVLKAWPASELNQIASLALNGQPMEMLINSTNAVVLSNDYNSNVKATIIDISQPSSPRILTEFEIPGYYKTARLIGDTLRIVNEDYNVYSMIETKGEDNTGWFQSSAVTRKLDIKQTNQIVGGQTRTLDVVKNCENVYVPKDVAPMSSTRIISINLKSKKYSETIAFIQPHTVYASETGIYLAQTGYTKNSKYSQEQTAIHKFALEEGKTALYNASGLIKGHLINQFAMDEFKGNLRVATTGSEFEGETWWGGRGGEWKQASRVQVLAPRGKKLVSIGQTPDLGKGERLYSARFDGERGFIVTFRQVDPLFTLDLSNPRNPRVMGELKVPGFSTYIHMLDKTHLLTIGQDADENTGGVRGLKLSVFDVSDFKRPREVKSLIFKQDVNSESSYEHKAFTFYREKGILAIPASQNSGRSSLLLFSVTTSNIKASGEVKMTDLQSVRRSFFADNIVYAIGGAGIRASTLENPENPLATVLFNQNVAEAGW